MDQDKELVIVSPDAVKKFKEIAKSYGINVVYESVDDAVLSKLEESKHIDEEYLCEICQDQLLSSTH